MFICKSLENSERLLLTTKFNETSLYLGMYIYATYHFYELDIVLLQWLIDKHVTM